MDGGLIMPKKKPVDTTTKENIPIVKTSGFVDFKTNKLYEQTRNKQFVCLQDDKKTALYVDEVTVTDKNNKPTFKFIPLSNKVTNIGVIPLPLMPVEYGSTDSLVKEIEDHIYKYLDISERFRKLSAWYDVMSWVKDNLNTINYLRALGYLGWGKSRFFNVVGKLCYKPIPFAGAINPAPLYRLMDQWHGTLLLDECVIKGSDQSNDLIQVLNAGIERNRYVFRCDPDNKNEVEPFDPFGPKVIASRESFQDNALESRCITEHMRPTNRPDIPIELPPRFYLEQNDLRNKLLMFRLRNWKMVNAENIDKIVLPKTTNRLKQMIMPFAITFYDHPIIIKDLNTFAEEYYKEQLSDSSKSLEGGVVYTIYLLHEGLGEANISSTDILEKMKNIGYETGNYKDVSIGIIRSNLGIDAKQKGGKKCIVYDERLMQQLIERFLTEEQVEYVKNLKKQIRSFEERNKVEPSRIFL